MHAIVRVVVERISSHVNTDMSLATINLPGQINELGTQHIPRIFDHRALTRLSCLPWPPKM